MVQPNTSREVLRERIIQEYMLEDFELLPKKQQAIYENDATKYQ